jgi:hypothetical protein
VTRDTVPARMRASFGLPDPRNGRSRARDSYPGQHAALRVFELSYGKPAETVEVDTTDMDPMRVAEMTQAERATIIRQLLAQHPNLIGLVPERMRGEYGLPPPP